MHGSVLCLISPAISKTLCQLSDAADTIAQTHICTAILLNSAGLFHPQGTAAKDGDPATPAKSAITRQYDHHGGTSRVNVGVQWLVCVEQMQICCLQPGLGLDGSNWQVYM